MADIYINSNRAARGVVDNLLYLAHQTADGAKATSKEVSCAEGGKLKAWVWIIRVWGDNGWEKTFNGLIHWNCTLECPGCNYTGRPNKELD